MGQTSFFGWGTLLERGIVVGLYLILRTGLLGLVLVLCVLMLEFVLFVLEYVSFVFWCYQTYKNGKYSIYPKGEPFGAYIR